MTVPVFREAATLHAISELRRKYPYSAALLAYVVVERVLKVRVLTLRHTLNFRKITMRRGPHDGKRLTALVDLQDGAFVKDVLCHLTLNEVEDALSVPQGARSSKDRNETVHSNIHLSREVEFTDRGRDRRNSARFKKAVGHLRYAIDKFSGHRLLEKRSGELIAQPNEPMQPSGSGGG